MRYLKVFEAKVKKDWAKMIIDIESDFRKMIKSNTDITLDYIKDISASALDIFRDENIQYDEFLEIGDDDDEDGDSYGFMCKDGKTIDEDDVGDADKGSYKCAVKFYKDLSTTKKNVYLNISIDVYFPRDSHLPIDDVKVKSLIEESKDIESRCKGHNIKFELDLRKGRPYASTGGYLPVQETDDSTGEVLYGFGLKFNKKIDQSKIKYDYRKIISPDAIADFDRFISMYKIPKEGEGDLLKLINAASKKKKKKD